MLVALERAWRYEKSPMVGTIAEKVQGPFGTLILAQPVLNHPLDVDWAAWWHPEMPAAIAEEMKRKNRAVC